MSNSIKLFKKPKPKNAPSKMWFICARHNQCKHPCAPNCLYTSDFNKSRLRHMGIKPAGYIDFLMDKSNELYEVDWNWDYNLPVAFRKKPETLVSFTYDDILNLAVSGALRRAKDEADPDIEIDFGSGSVNG